MMSEEYIVPFLPFAFFFFLALSFLIVMVQYDDDKSRAEEEKRFTIRNIIKGKLNVVEYLRATCLHKHLSDTEMEEILQYKPAPYVKLDSLIGTKQIPPEVLLEALEVSKHETVYKDALKATNAIKKRYKSEDGEENGPEENDQENVTSDENNLFIPETPPGLPEPVSVPVDTESRQNLKKWFEESRRKHPRSWSGGLLVVKGIAVITAAIGFVYLIIHLAKNDPDSSTTINDLKFSTTHSSVSTAVNGIFHEKSSTLLSDGGVSLKSRDNRSLNEGIATTTKVGTEMRESLTPQNGQLQQSFFSSKVTDDKLERNFPYPDERLSEDPTCVTVQSGNKWQYFIGSTRNAKVDRNGDVRIRRNGTFDSFFRVRFFEFPYRNKTLSADIVLKRRSSDSKETLGYCNWTISEREILERDLQQEERAEFSCTFSIREEYRRSDELWIETYEESTICEIGTGISLVPIGPVG